MHGVALARPGVSPPTRWEGCGMRRSAPAAELGRVAPTGGSGRSFISGSSARGSGQAVSSRGGAALLEKTLMLGKIEGGRRRG